MPRISRKIINKELNSELNETFSFLISDLRHSREINDFFKNFLTKEEKTMLFKRLMLHLMLLNNIPSSEIKASLGMSNETIRTYKNNWDSLSDEYKQVINKISKRKNINDLLRNLDGKTDKLQNFLKAKSSMKARSKVYGDK